MHSKIVALSYGIHFGFWIFAFKNLEVRTFFFFILSLANVRDRARAEAWYWNLQILHVK